MSGPSSQDPYALLNMIAFTVIQASHESASSLGVLKDNYWVHKCTQTFISSIMFLTKMFATKD